MVTDIIQEMTGIVAGMVNLLPDIKITIGVLVVLALLAYFRGGIGFLIFFLLVSLLFASVIFSGSDIYALSLERIIAVVIIGGFLVVVDLYLVISVFADWR
jgi:hypothetical protein